MKKKSNGTYRARLVARGFQQRLGKDYDGNATSAPVVNNATIRILLVLSILAAFDAWVVDVKGAFLKGNFKSWERVHMRIPEGMQTLQTIGWVLLLLKTIYGLKQAAFAFG